MPPYNIKINELQLLKNLRFLPAGEEIRFFFGQYKNDGSQSEDKSILREYKIMVSYKDVDGRKYGPVKFSYDPREYGPLSGLAHTKTIRDVVEVLNEINNSINKSSKE